jgi:hypothetical protein
LNRILISALGKCEPSFLPAPLQSGVALFAPESAALVRPINFFCHPPLFAQITAKLLMAAVVFFCL